MWKYVRLPSGSASLSIGYITTGILMIIWTVVWLIYMHANEVGGSGQYYICGGLIASGAALLGIGILMGRIGQEAKHADAAAPMTDATVSNAPTPAQVGMVAQPMVAAGQQAAPVMMVPATPMANGAQAQVPQTMNR